jgi:mevalonate kinase
MPAFTAHAPGKIILFGEHAVVYGQPAIAVPVNQVRATATITPDIKGKPGMVRIQAPDIHFEAQLDALPSDHALAAAVHGVAVSLGGRRIPACTLRVSSSIPVASGLGSGAAVSVAIIRAMSAFLGHPMPNNQISDLAYEVEKIHHGTPSGIDNTVVTFAQPVYFTKNQALETFQIAKPFRIVIGDTGIPSPTRESVSDVRESWQAEAERFEALFAAVGSIARAARQAIESGHPDRLGPLMNENHELLQAMGVSSPALDQLVQAAQNAGALGAKLSGGGRGGNMIAITNRHDSEMVARQLRAVGATRVILTEIG